MKKLFLLVISLALLVSFTCTLLLEEGANVLFASKESKTIQQKSVYNRITLFSKPDQDIWMMNQSHDGLNASSENWDRLAIVIDKTQSPKTARFYQLPPGELNANENFKPIPYKVSCFMCHPNGPRWIRPQEKSLNLKDKLTLFFWNLKILSYGRVLPHPEHEKESLKSQIPFKWNFKQANIVLDLKSCNDCHDEKGFIQRGALLSQNLLSIKFMVDQGFMPPMGHSLSKKDKAKIEKYFEKFFN